MYMSSCAIFIRSVNYIRSISTTYSTLLIFFIFLHTILILPLHAQINRYVSVTGDDVGGASTCFDPNAPCRTIAHALDVSTPGDSINIAGGAYTENIIINKSIALKGAAQGVTIIQAHAQQGMPGGRVITISGATDVRIADLTIRHGSVSGPTGFEDGGGIFNDGSTLSLINVALFRNHAVGYGGGILHKDGSMNLMNVTFTENTAAIGGGLSSVHYGSVTLDEVVFKDNIAVNGGGMSISNGISVMTQVTFTGNQSNVEGGGLTSLESSLTLTNVTFDRNSSGSGGGIFNSISDVTLYNVVFTENTAIRGTQTKFGGGICSMSSSLIFNNVSFVGNSSTHAGGGMFSTNNSPIFLSDVSFIENISDTYGGGMYSDGNYNVVLRNVLLRGNRAEDGGGIYSTGDTSPLLIDVTFDENIANVDGGGIYYSIIDTASLRNVVFTGNSSGNNGGGMFSMDSFPVLTHISFTRNSADSEGGGMYIFSGTQKLTNVSFNGNSADDGGGMFIQGSSPHITNGVFKNNKAGNGGAIYNYNNSHPPLTNLTLAGNRATLEGGGIYNKESSPVLTNVIVWNNKQENSTSSVTASIYNDEMSGPNISYSLIANSGGSGGGWNSALGIDRGNNIGSDPLFVADPDPDDAPAISGNLGLQAGSPAIDSGDPDILISLFPVNEENAPIDLAANLRINNGIIDMGAYEYHDPSTFVKADFQLPKTIELYQNYPNPFNPSTVIRFDLPERMEVELAIFNLLGQKVAVLVGGQQNAGRYEIEFEAHNLPSGVYVYRLRTGTEIRSGKMLLIR
jgi:predicted outer membrane repeat protein